MTLNDLNDLANKMGIDPSKPIEILWPDGLGSWDYSTKFGMQRAADGGMYVTPEKIHVPS